MSDPVAYAYYMINQRVVDERDRVRAWARLWKAAAKKYQAKSGHSMCIRLAGLDRRAARHAALTEAAEHVRWLRNAYWKAYSDPGHYQGCNAAITLIEALRDGE